MIRQVREADIPHITRIHINSLKGDFLPSLGKDFLELIYKGVIDAPDIYGFVNSDGDKVTGFVIGTRNMDIFLKTALKKNFIKLSVVMMIQLLKRPGIIKNILETILYSKKESGPAAELVVIAVSKKSQGQGIGKKLVKMLETEFKKIKINKYKLTVYSDKKAIKFYEALNFYKIANFNLYSKEWSVLEKKIN